MNRKKNWLMIALLIICGIAFCYLVLARPQVLSLSGTVSSDQHKRLFLATGSPGGTYYSLGNSMAHLWNKALTDEMEILTQTSGASVENIRMLENGDAQLMLAVNNTADDAWRGRGDFNNKMGHFRSIGTICPEVLQIVVRRENNATEIPEIIEKKINIGPNGSGSAVFAKDFLALVNSAKQNLKLYNLTFEDGINSMKQGEMDATVVLLALPSAAINDLSRECPVNLLNLDDELIAKVEKLYPLISKFTIPAGTYGNEQPVNTVSFKAVLFCKDDLPDEVVYDLTKTLYEQNKELAKAHIVGRYVDLATALDGVTVPLHRGAAKYYKEKGLTIAQEIEPID